MTTYFVTVDSIRRNTKAFEYTFGKFASSGGAAMLGYWLIWPFEILKNQI